VSRLPATDQRGRQGLAAVPEGGVLPALLPRIVGGAESPLRRASEADRAGPPAGHPASGCRSARW